MKRDVINVVLLVFVAVVFGLAGCGGGGGDSGGSGSGGTQPVVPASIVRTETSQNLPATADQTIGTANSYMPLTTGTTLKYNFTSSAGNGNVTMNVTQGGSSPAMNISADANVLGYGNLTMQAQTQKFSISNNALYVSAISGNGTIQSISFTMDVTQTPPSIFFPSTTAVGTSVNLNNSTKLTVTSQGKSESQTFTGSGTLKIASISDTVTTPAGTFTKALRTELTTGGSIQETRWFVAGIGQVKYQTSQGSGLLKAFTIATQ